MSYPELGQDSPARSRNPSPPREVIGLTDSIGATAFSKHWLFSTLMKLIQVIDNQSVSGDGTTDTQSDNEGNSTPKKSMTASKMADQSRLNKHEENSKADSEKPADSSTETVNYKQESREAEDKDAIDGDTKNGESTDNEDNPQGDVGVSVIDISDELQDELCQLWDMSMDEDVAKLLQEFKAIDILTEVISKSNAPRATEIAIGILGNMACTSSVCDSMSDSDSLVNVSINILSNPDAPTLVETTRFLSIVLANSNTREKWLNAWQNLEDSHQQIIFILQSSVNKDLLKNTAELLDILLDISEQLCSSWSSSELLLAVIEALKQVGLAPSEAAFNLLHIIQLISTQPSGVAAIIDQVEIVTDCLMEYLLTTCEDEIVNLEGSKAGAIASALSVLDIALTSSPAVYSILFSGEKCIRCMLKVAYACDKEAISNADGGTPNSSSSAEEENLLDSLKDVLYNFVQDTLVLMRKEEVDVSQCEDEIPKTESSQPTPAILKYMNSECERVRIQSLVRLIIDQKSNNDLLDLLLTLADRYSLARLAEIITTCS